MNNFSFNNLNQKLILLSIGLLLFALPAVAKTYYIAESGADSQPGTSPDSAWASFVNITGQTLQPGDSVLLKKGSVFSDQITVPISGTENARLYFGSYGLGPKPVIRDSLHGFYLSGKSYVTIDGFRITATRSSGIIMKSNSLYNTIRYCTIDSCSIVSPQSAGGIQMNTAKYATIDSCTIIDCWGEGILVQNSAGCKLSRLYITGLLVHAENGGPDCVQIIGSSDSVSVDSSWMSQEGTESPKGCIQINAGINHVTITNNTLLHGNFGVSPNGSNILVKGNTIAFQGMESGETWASAIRFGGAWNGTQVTQNLTVVQNIIYGCRNHGIQLVNDHPHENFVFYNNVVYNCGGGFHQKAGTISGEFKNNIIWSENATLPLFDPGEIIAGETFTADYNNIGPNFSAIGAHSISSDPLFVAANEGNFHLSAQSPCINSGMYVGLDKDKDGTTITAEGLPDMGAYEFAEITGLNQVHSGAFQFRAAGSRAVLINLNGVWGLSAHRHSGMHRSFSLTGRIVPAGTMADGVRVGITK